RLLVNPAWLDASLLSDFELIPVPESEPWGANVTCLGEQVCAAAAHTRTASLISRLGFEVRTVELDEFFKAEAGITCLSLLIS
ncbi:MAG TPA: hypothetical protein VKU82_01390, partial [Planctomycetaceae bacterium]|nr:hypothetical protein [Planctomycetaceae bacterium]